MIRALFAASSAQIRNAEPGGGVGGVFPEQPDRFELIEGRRSAILQGRGTRIVPMPININDVARIEERIRALPAGTEISSRIRSAVVPELRSRSDADDCWPQIAEAFAFCSMFPARAFRELAARDDFDVLWALTFACDYWGRQVHPSTANAWTSCGKPDSRRKPAIASRNTVCQTGPRLGVDAANSNCDPIEFRPSWARAHAAGQ